MKLKFDFSAMPLGERVMAVPVGEDAKKTQSVLNMNSSAAEILSLLKEETTEDAVVLALMGKYDVSREELTDSVRQLVNQLREAQLLSE